MVHHLLLETLEDLGKDDFATLKWYLTINILDGCKPIPMSQLEDSRRIDTVTTIIKSYGEEMAVNVAVEILKKMRNNYAAEKLQISHAEGKAAVASSSSSSSSAAAHPAAAAAAPATMSAQQGGVVIAPTVGGTFQTLNITVNK